MVHVASPPPFSLPNIVVENPTQAPGSDYGRQKRACRELLDEFGTKHGGDPRVAVLPGVLHSEPVWGNGTTEYALDAMLAASRGQSYVCPIGPDVMLPMVYVDDLMRVGRKAHVPDAQIAHSVHAHAENASARSRAGPA